MISKPTSLMAQQIAQSAAAFQHQRTGHAPAAVTVVQSDGTLVITLHDALTPAEKAMAKTPKGASKVQEFHRKLFMTSASALRDEITRITGVAVREATAEIEPKSGTVVQVFTNGTMVQVFLLAHGVPAAQWDAQVGGEAL